MSTSNLLFYYIVYNLATYHSPCLRTLRHANIDLRFAPVDVAASPPSVLRRSQHSPCQHRPPLRSRRCCGFAVYIFVVIVLPASKLAQNNDNADVHGSLDAQNASAGEPHRGVITRCTTLLYFIGRRRLKPHYRYGSNIHDLISFRCIGRNPSSTTLPGFCRSRSAVSSS